MVLNNKKIQLKRAVDEEFAQFFIKNVQRLDIISSAVNNNNNFNNKNKTYNNNNMLLVNINKSTATTTSNKPFLKLNKQQHEKQHPHLSNNTSPYNN